MTGLPRRHRVASLTMAAALVTVLSGCGSNVDGPGEGTVTSGEGEFATSEALHVTATHHDVEYYDPCGNTVFRFDDLDLYPIPHVESQQLPLETYRELAGVTTPSSAVVVVELAAAPIGWSVPMVPAPQEGDDIGTLIVFSDGLALFVSDSGMESWLSTGEREFGWVC